MKKFFLIFIIIFLCFVFYTDSLFSTSRSKDIPGIDPLPIAIIENKENINVESKTTIPNQNQNTNLPPNTTESLSKEYPDFPRIRNLKVMPDPAYPFSARITWDLHPQTSTPIYVVRYSRPISTREILLNAYNLTSPPLNSNTTTFVDIDIPEGVYYYAAVTSFELSKNGILILKPDVNYTITPFIVYRGREQKKGEIDTPDKYVGNLIDRSNLNPTDFEVQELVATNTDRAVILSWKPVNIDNVKYRVYKGYEPLDSLERLRNAKYLGETVAPNFIDENPIVDETVYYGVSVFDAKENKEYTNLKFKRSYIVNTFKKPRVEYQYMEFIPDSLVAYQVNKNTIQIFWVDAGPQVKFYKVYRHSYPISNETILQQSEFVGISQSGSFGFIDKDLKQGRYFYAVLPVISNNNELKIFQANKTFTTFGINILGSSEFSKKDEEKREIFTEVKDIKNNIKNISIKVEENNNIRIIWDYSPENANKIKVLIYRSPVLIQKYEDLKENAIYLGEFPLVASVFVDKNVEPGNHYYNFIEYNTDTNEISAFYYLKRPVEIWSSTKKPKTNYTSKRLKKDTNNSLEIEIEAKKEDSSERINPTSTNEENKEINIDQEIEFLIDLIFNKKNYPEAENKINSLLKIHTLNAYYKGKLKYYYGILLYKVNRTKEARMYFLDDDVQKYDQQSADFWYKRSLESK